MNQEEKSEVRSQKSETPRTFVDGHGFLHPGADRRAARGEYRMPETLPASKLFFHTTAAQMALQSLDRIVKEEIIGMVIARPGLGKTQSINFWRSHQGAAIRHVWIKVNVSTSPRPTLTALARGLGLERCRGRLADMHEGICAALAQDPVTVIMDEADLLTVRSFDLLRSIWDEVAALRGFDGERGFPLALFGDIKLRHILGRPDLERLHRRIFHRREFPPLSASELATVLKKWGVRYDAEAFAELQRLIRGSFGWLNPYMRRAQELFAGNGNTLTARILRATERDLEGILEPGNAEEILNGEL